MGARLRFSIVGAVALCAPLFGCNDNQLPTTSAQSVQETGGGTTGTSGGTNGGNNGGNNGGGTNVTCAVTLGLNGGTPSTGANAIQAKVGDDATFHVTTSASNVQYHWYGTRDGTPDTNQVVTDPAAFSGFFQDVAGGHTYTRYVVIEDASTKTPLCNTEASNGGKPMTVTVAPGPSCSLTLALNNGQASAGATTPISANVGDSAAFLVSTNATGARFHWYGTKDGVDDVSGSGQALQTSPTAFSGPFATTAGGHTYTRYVVVEDAATGAPLCNTQTSNGGKPMTVMITPPPTCSLTLAIGAGQPSMNNISTNEGMYAKFAVSTNATGVQYHWYGTQDGVDDVSGSGQAIQTNPGAFTGYFQSGSGGHIYTRYVVVEKANNGFPVCDSRTANGGQPMTVSISATPGCTLAVDHNPIDTSGGPVNVTWTASSIAADTNLYLNGTKNGAPDANMTFFGNIPGNNLSVPLTYDSSLVGDYTRTGVLLDGVTGLPVCQTNTVSVKVK